MASPKPRLEVRDLEIVLAVASAGSTTRAASVLHLTQSAVSRALGLAEEKLGVRLFDRGRHGLSLTRAGERLVAGAGALLAQLVELERSATGHDVTPVRVRLVCECYTAYRWLPSALHNLRRALPSLEVELAIEHTGAPVEALRAGKIDIALLTTAPISGRGLEERALFSDEVVFVVSRTHPLARRKSLTALDLQAYPLITAQAPDAEVRWFAQRVFGRRRPHVQFLRLPLTEAIADATRAGMGIAILSEWIASGYLEGGDLVVKRLAAGPLRRPWRMAYRREVAETAGRLAAALEGTVPRLVAAS